MAAIIFLMLGLFFTGVDIHMATGVAYPTYVTNHDLGEVIQMNITKYITNDHLTIDIFPDVIGCLFLVIGISMLIKHSKRFAFGYILIVTTALLSVAVRVLPFYLNGKELIIAEMAVYFFLIVSELYMEFLIIYTTVDISDALANQATNKRMQFGWWLTVICRVFIVLLTFVGHLHVMHYYLVVNIAATLFYLYQMFGIRNYIGKKGV